MKYDFVNELGYLALATRLKRISEAMVHSGRDMYKTLELDIEPNWYLIFKLLQKYERLSVMEMAAKLHFAHPSVISLVNKMEANGYLESAPDKTDSRKRQFSLSEKARTNMPQFEKVWKAGTVGVQNLFQDNSFLEQLESIEIQLSQKDFKERTLNELANE